ncbi:MAG: zf-HC2 domain-containing protein [Candidatus Erginobacter occultus]|nr:zf-HC2 domain-containing protein [Candidatus Erginobacter occultus]
MNCSDREKSISDYLDGVLNARQEKELEDHLRACSACREVLRRMEKAGRLVRETVNSPAPTAENWEARRERIKRNIIAKINPAGRPATSRSPARFRLPAIPALAAGILLLAAAGLFWRMAILRRPENGKGEIPAADAHGGVPGDRYYSAAAMMGKDFSLFRGIQESFSQRVEWVTIDGRAVDFDLDGGETEIEPDTRPPLVFLAFQIFRDNDGPEGRVVSAPRIVVRDGVELIKDFPLSPEPDANYRLRITPRMAAGDRINLTLDLVFRQTGPDGPEEARLSASSTIIPGEVTLLGSILPGDEFYRVEVLSEVEEGRTYQPGENIL